MKKRDLVRSLMFCILAAVIMLGGMTMKVEAGQVQVPIAAFTPYASGGGSYSFWYAPGEWYIYGNGVCLIAPIYFPSTPSKIKNVTFYVIDNNGSEHFAAILFGSDMTDSTSGELLFYGTTSSFSSSMQELVLIPSNPKLNKKYQYALEVCLNSDQQFYGAQVNW